MPSKKELLKKRKLIKEQMWEVEQLLKLMTFVSSVDFASMYPSVIRLLNASIESMVGFLNDNPISYRVLGLSDTIKNAKDLSKDLVKTTIKDSDYTKFVGKKEEKISLRRDLYSGKYADASIEEITETPFEQYFLASVGLFDDTEIKMTFQGKEYTVSDLNAYFKEMGYSVSGSGAVFKKSMSDTEDELGLIPSYLAYLFQERKNVKKQMFVHYKSKLLLQKFKMAAEKDGLYS